LTSIGPRTSIEDLAGLVCATLARHGVDVVLSGGAVVSIYSENAYQSYDLDFVPIGLTTKVADAMRELGFARRDPRNWVHPRTRFSLEFPPGPVTAGGVQISKFASRRTKHGKLAPTECVMDRLSKYFHWGDLQGLEQAIEVAKRQRVNLAREADARGVDRPARVHLLELQAGMIGVRQEQPKCVPRALLDRERSSRKALRKRRVVRDVKARLDPGEPSCLPGAPQAPRPRGFPAPSGAPRASASNAHPPQGLPGSRRRARLDQRREAPQRP
jgi:hypothetical protein